VRETFIEDIGMEMPISGAKPKLWERVQKFRIRNVAPKPPKRKALATGPEIAAWIIVALGILFLLYHHLLSALLAGLFVYSIVHRIAGQLTNRKMEGHKAKWVALGIVSLALILLAAGIVLAVLAVVKGHAGGIHEMMQKITEVVEQFRDWFSKRGIGEWIPDADKLHEKVVQWLKENSAERGIETGKMFIHALVGIVIGALLSFYTPKHPGGPLRIAFYERMSRFATAFERVVFAQVKISALNTTFTAIYLLVVLPMFGVNLPLHKTLVLVTFVAGLLPVVGNLISNTIIVLISLGIGAGVAVSSLIFLIVIHKLEYFLNAKIVGGEIKASAWEILLAMVCFEAAFGISGVIIAPIVYAYMKAEMRDKGLI